MRDESPTTLLLTAGALAAQVGRSIDWVREHADAGHLPFMRDSSNRRMFTVGAIDAAAQLIKVSDGGARRA